MSEECDHRVLTQHTDTNPLPKNYSWFVESSHYDIDVMWKELLHYAESLSEPLKVLTISLLEERREDFSQHAAAKFNHHPYLGGLLEHTLNVVNHCN
mgnify:CR=1 FL=1